MTESLPTADQLEKLSLRAIVAYDSRNARRLSMVLRGIIADEVLDEALQRASAVSTSPLIEQLDEAEILYAAARVVEAYEVAPSEMTSLTRFRAVFSITDAALAAMSAYEAVVTDSVRAAKHRKYAAQRA